MDPDEKKEHLKELWKKALLKSRAGSQIINLFNDLHKKILLFGV